MPGSAPATGASSGIGEQFARQLGVEVELLVNNAGFGSFGCFWEIEARGPCS